MWKIYNHADTKSDFIYGAGIEIRWGIDLLPEPPVDISPPLHGRCYDARPALASTQNSSLIHLVNHSHENTILGWPPISSVAMATETWHGRMPCSRSPRGPGVERTSPSPVRPQDVQYLRSQPGSSQHAQARQTAEKTQMPYLQKPGRS
jgi:hypothetical protein